MSMKKLNKNTLILLIGVLTIIILLAGIVISYIAYGNTMIYLDTNSEETLNEYLAIDKEKHITVLATIEYSDRFAILYTDPVDVEMGNGDDYAHFYVFIKQKFYKNRYVIDGYVSGNFTNPACYQLDEMESLHAVCFIADIENNEKKCSVFESDMYLNIVRKLDEFDTSETSYIVVKEYELADRLNHVTVSNGSADTQDFQQ